MALGILRTEIPEGGVVAGKKWWLCIAEVYGYLSGACNTLNKDDYQGWIACLKLPIFQWFAEGHMQCDRATWARKCIIVRHVYLQPPRLGKNGSGWQGWDWETSWLPCEADY